VSKRSLVKWFRDEQLTLDTLSLVGETEHVTAADVASWTDEQCQQAEDWALATHFYASDNPRVRIPPKPAFLEQPEGTRTATRPDCGGSATVGGDGTTKGESLDQQCD
jgi:hypothetical protein